MEEEIGRGRPLSMLTGQALYVRLLQPDAGLKSLLLFKPSERQYIYIYINIIDKQTRLMTDFRLCRGLCFLLAAMIPDGSTVQHHPEGLEAVLTRGITMIQI